LATPSGVEGFWESVLDSLDSEGGRGELECCSFTSVDVELGGQWKGEQTELNLYSRTLFLHKRNEIDPSPLPPLWRVDLSLFRSLSEFSWISRDVQESRVGLSVRNLLNRKNWSGSFQYLPGGDLEPGISILALLELKF
jgi:hypothetical protein